MRYQIDVLISVLLKYVGNILLRFKLADIENQFEDLIIKHDIMMHLKNTIIAFFFIK